MSQELLPDLLQECLAAYDSGVAPEECLSAYPTRRGELEPLFRQALSLRISYAASPSIEFRDRAKDALMFAAGREVVHAFESRPDREFVKDARAKFTNAAGAQAQQALRSVPDPDPRYVSRTRNRLVHAAGAPAQEALRAVPPPRLPFWWNTRRNLLEAAAAKSLPQARPMPARRPFGAFVFQAGLSMAVVVLAVTAGALVFLTNQPATPSAAAEVASLERQINDLEARAAAGQPVSGVEVRSLAQQTTDLAIKIKEQPSTVGASKLPALIERQQTVVANVYANVPPPPEVVEAQQQLDKVAAAVQPSPAAALAAATSTPVPPTATAAAPTATATSTPVPAPLQQGQVRISLLASDTFGGITWQEIRTANARIVAPSSWQVPNVIFDSNGVARLVGNSVGLVGTEGQSITVMVDVDGPTAGQILAIINGQTLILRGLDGRFISADELVAKAGALSPILRHMLETFEIGTASVNVTPPPAPTATATSTPTQTPVATNTPAPTATKTATPKAASPTSTPRTATPSATPPPNP